MAVRKQCKSKGCKTSPRCDHRWWFDLMHKGKRYRMRVDDFAIPRMKEAERHPVTTKSEAERVWEPLYIGEIMVGKDPRRPPSANEGLDGPLTVAEFLNRYETYKTAEGPRSIGTIKGRLKTLRERLGKLPMAALEHPDHILAFKNAYREERAIATVNRVLSTLRTAINRGRAQVPPLIGSSPFHKFGVTIKVKEERKRDRRVSPKEEQDLLSSCQKMAGAEHRFVGGSMHDRIIGAIETCCRLGELLRIQNKHVDWENRQIAIPGTHTKDSENRRIPFDPDGRLAQILRRRMSLGPNAYVFGTPSGQFQNSIRTAWESLVLIAHGVEPEREKKGGRVSREKFHEIDLRFHDLRHEGACRLYADGMDIRTIQLMLGHSTLMQTQRYLNVTDEELRSRMEVGWKTRKERLQVVRR